MKRKNTTRSALFTSVISLLLCVSMLVGTTFAWFTDEVKSGTNVIAAGNLDVELYHSKEKNVQIVDENKVGTDTLLFTDVNGEEIKNWEPGVVAYTNLKVANVGTLALKYQLSINSTETNHIQYADGSIYTLADALKIAVVEGGFEGDRTAAQKLDVEWKPMKSFSLSGELEGDEKSNTYGIVIYWEPGENDNIFNMNNGKTTSDGKPLTITLGVNLFATQEMYENDSFGDDYDKLAPWAGQADIEWYDANATEYTITSAEELAGLAKIVNNGTDTFVGKTVKLAANIDLNGAPWTPIGSSADGWNTKFNGTFIGTGYTISNLHVTGTTGLGLFGYVGNAAHIEGVTIDGAYVSGTDYVGAVVGSGYLAANCVKNCTVMNAEIIATPYLMADGKTYDGGAKAGAIGGLLYNGNISGNKAINCRITAFRDVGGIVGMIASESRQISASDNEVKNVTLTYLDLNGAAYYESKVNEYMGNVVGRVGSNASVGENTETDVTRNTVIYWIENDVEYTKDVDTGAVTFKGLTAAFEGDTVTVRSDTAAIGSYAFSQSSIKTVVLNEGLKSIENRAFQKMPNMTSIIIPSTVEFVGEYAFQGSKLTTLTIPASVTRIDQGAFAYSTTLESIIIEGSPAIGGSEAASNASLNYVARACPNLTSVYILGNPTYTTTGIIFSNTEGGVAEKITVYVANEEVANAYKAACTCTKYTIVVADFVDGEETLQERIDAATDGAVIVLTEDYTGDLTVTQKPNVKFTIDGAGHTFAGVIVVDGKSATYTTAGLTIKNVNFKADSISADACIRLGNGTNATRYTCNVTVSGCTFDVPGAVGVKSYTGGDKNLTITDCTATAQMHSLVQAKGIDGVLVENCEVYSKNGLNFNNSDNVTVSGCTVDVLGYAVRFGESSGGAGSAETYTIKNSTLKSACDDGDAVVILRGTADNATLTMTNTSLVGDIQIKDTASNAIIVINGKYYVSTAAELAAVVANGATDIYLLDGVYDVYGCGGKTLTISGSKNAVIKLYNDGEDGCDYAFGSAGTGVGTYTFNGVTFDTTGNTGNYKGFAYMKGIFNDCNFVGAYSLNNANDYQFNRCTFDFKNGYFWTWGAKSVTFNGCTFNGNSKAILAHGTEATVININNCTFAATEKGYTGAGDNTAAIEMDPVVSNTYTINFTGKNTITDSYAGWTRVKDGSTGHVTTEPTAVDTPAALENALQNGDNIELSDDLTISTADTSSNSGYGATGVTVNNGDVFDGNGNTFTVEDADGVWDCAVNPQNGTVQNMTVAGAFRGIFMSTASGDVYIDHVIVKDVAYTFNSDGGNKAYGVYISNSELYGWTSFSNVHKEVVFTNCIFGEGNGYAFCRPYNACVFENCVFQEGFKFDTAKTSNITFINCYYGDTLITAENAATLGDGATTFFYNGLNGITIQ